MADVGAATVAGVQLAPRPPSRAQDGSDDPVFRASRRASLNSGPLEPAAPVVQALEGQ